MQSGDTFKPGELALVSRAVTMAEEEVTDYFKISAGKWKNYRYDIKTAGELDEEELDPHAFAKLVRYRSDRLEKSFGAHLYDYFKVCLQDHNLLAATERDRGLHLLPLVLYVVVHELVHIVRFSTFLANFEVDSPARDDEEARVHDISQEILRPLVLPGLEYVLSAYRKLGTVDTLGLHRP